jgi:hypothetical protein
MHVFIFLFFIIWILVIGCLGVNYLIAIIITSTVGDLMAVSAPTQLWNIEKISVCAASQSAWCVFWVSKDSSLTELTKTTAILEKRGGAWKVVHAQASLSCPVEQASASLAASIMKK